MTAVDCKSQNGGDRQYCLKEMNPELPKDDIAGEWIGLLRTSKAGTEAIKTAIEELRDTEDFSRLQMFDLFNHLVRSGKTVSVHYIVGHWLDVDNICDLAEAERLNF